jgi:hypothetical protein
MILFKRATSFPLLPGRGLRGFCSDEDFKKQVHLEITNENAQ